MRNPRGPSWPVHSGCRVCGRQGAPGGLLPAAPGCITRPTKNHARGPWESISKEALGQALTHQQGRGPVLETRKCAHPAPPTPHGADLSQAQPESEELVFRANTSGPISILGALDQHRLTSAASRAPWLPGNAPGGLDPCQQPSPVHPFACLQSRALHMLHPSQGARARTGVCTGHLPPSSWASGGVGGEHENHPRGLRGRAQEGTQVRAHSTCPARGIWAQPQLTPVTSPLDRTIQRKINPGPPGDRTQLTNS